MLNYLLEYYLYLISFLNENAFMCLNFTKMDSNTSALIYPSKLWLNIFNMNTFIYYNGVIFFSTSAKASLNITPPLDEVIVG